MPFEQPVMDLFLIYMATIYLLAHLQPSLAGYQPAPRPSPRSCLSLHSTSAWPTWGAASGVAGDLLGMIVGDLILPFWFVPYLLMVITPNFSSSFSPRN